MGKKLWAPSYGERNLAQAFFESPATYDQYGGTDGLLRHLSADISQKMDIHIVDTLRNFLDDPPGLEPAVARPGQQTGAADTNGAADADADGAADADGMAGDASSPAALTRAPQRSRGRVGRAPSAHPPRPTGA